MWTWWDCYHPQSQAFAASVAKLLIIMVCHTGSVLGHYVAVREGRGNNSSPKTIGWAPKAKQQSQC